MTEIGVKIENMAKLPLIEELAKDVAQRAMQEITINDMHLLEFVEKVNNAVENNNCNLITFRYNKNDLEDKLLTEIMEKHYKEFGLNEENRYIFRDVVEKYGDMTYRHLCENYCFAFEME